MDAARKRGECVDCLLSYIKCNNDKCNNRLCSDHSYECCEIKGLFCRDCCTHCVECDKPILISELPHQECSCAQYCYGCCNWYHVECTIFSEKNYCEYCVKDYDNYHNTYK